MADFIGDRECVTHHACDCMKRKAAERDTLQAQNSKLLKGIEEKLAWLSVDDCPDELPKWLVSSHFSDLLGDDRG